MSGDVMFILIFSGIWCMMGVIFLCVALAMRRSAERKEERLRGRATGTVTEVIRRGTNGRYTTVTFHPIVEFEADGKKVALEYADGGGRKSFYEGQTVDVLYDPDDPARFMLAGHRGETQVVSTTFLAVGLGCIAIGVVVGLIIALTGSNFLR